MNHNLSGSMDENTRNTIRKASRVAHTVGWQQRTYDTEGYGHRQSPGPLETAGTIGHGMTNDRDYKSEMSFRCR